MGDDLRAIDAVSPPTQNAHGLAGRTEWFLWQQLYNLNVWERAETCRRPPHEGCYVTVMYVSWRALIRYLWLLLKENYHPYFYT